MAPKTNLITAGTTDCTKKRAPVNPITTQGKIARATAKAQNKKPALREKPADLNAKSKKRTLPPPGEAFVVHKADGADKTSTRPGSPITTQQKIALKNAQDRARGGVTKVAKAVGPAAAQKTTAQNQGRAGAGKNKGSRIPKVPMMATLREHQGTAQMFHHEKGWKSITMRRTQKAEIYARSRAAEALRRDEVRRMWESMEVQCFLKRAKDISAGNKSLSQLIDETKKIPDLTMKVESLLRVGVLPGKVAGLKDLTLVDLHGNSEVFRLMDLPDGVRLDIYRMAVVDDRAFVRPDTPTGREQPDLAMTCRKARAEVLPVFYAGNTFAIDLVPAYLRPPGLLNTGIGEGSVRTKNPLLGLLAIEKWATALQPEPEPKQKQGDPRDSTNCLVGDWFRYIRRWVFDYAPPASTSLFIPDNGSACAADMFHAEDDDDDSFMVSLHIAPETKKSSKSSKASKSSSKVHWSLKHLEVHRDARCLMPAFEEYGKCGVARTPNWLNEAVIDLLDQAGSRGYVDYRAVAGLAKVIERKAADLIAYRCE